MSGPGNEIINLSCPSDGSSYVARGCRRRLSQAEPTTFAKSVSTYAERAPMGGPKK